MGFDKEFDYISHRNALRDGFFEEIVDISHCNAFRWVLIIKLIILLIEMPCDGL